MMHITVKTLSGEVCPFEVDGTCTVQQLKATVTESTSMSTDLKPFLEQTIVEVMTGKISSSALDGCTDIQKRNFFLEAAFPRLIVLHEKLEAAARPEVLGRYTKREAEVAEAETENAAVKVAKGNVQKRREKLLANIARDTKAWALALCAGD